MAGLIHIYCGDGKGKTTAAIGLAVRAAGAGKKVIFAQFLKNGTSSEIQILSRLDSVTPYFLSSHRGFIKNMNEKERENAQSDFTKLFRDVIQKAKEEADLLILDEAIASCNYGMIPEGELLIFLKEKPAELEVVMTGRNPSKQLLKLADYVTEMKKVKHPYDHGINARYGIEF